ncbi:hypothetical protein C8R41DRAFT_280918 [Lentinula lateritia]|uniref:BCAS3 WD40 domain-containing protein n=1 Tax=Lentinula lateritia TaxID=40482 RepID=A0ABQ8VXA6_9AGAR|nr:hypothetical protein C8R41DRAFT_280918 [Lentinula lateritia]
MFRTQNLSQILSQLVVILPPSPLLTPPDTPCPPASDELPLPPLSGNLEPDADAFFDSAGRSTSSLGDAFSRVAANDFNLPSLPYYSASPPTSAPFDSSTFTLSPPSSSHPAKLRTSIRHHGDNAGRASSLGVDRPSATLSGNDVPVSGSSDSNDSSFESADRAPIAYSNGTADLNDTFHLDSQHMEGTIRPSKRVSNGYSYGFSPAVASQRFASSSTGREGRDGGEGASHASLLSTTDGRARRAPQYELPHVRDSALSRALANTESGKRVAQSATQSNTARSPSAAAIPVSINGAPDEGDTIISARWDHSLSGRRLLFLSYHPSGMQIWDCTDLNSVTELLNLPSESVRQLIANDSNPNEDLLDVVVAYAGIIPGGPLEETSLTLGILVTPTEDKRDLVDEASDSVLLTSKNEVLPESADNYTLLLIYSLVDHQVTKRIRIPGLAVGGGRFEVGNDCVVVSTTVPPALHVLSSTTFDVLHQIPSSDILPFCHKSSHSSSRRHSFLETTSNIVNGIYNNYNEHFNDKYHNLSYRNNVTSPSVEHHFSSDLSSTSLDATGEHYGRQQSDYNRQRRATMHGQDSQAAELPSMNIPETTPLPAPVFSVSGRLLAYASSPEGNTSLSVNGVQPRTSSTLSDAAVSTASAFGSTLSAQLASIGGAGGASGALGALGGISQADVGHAALKVGGSVLSGMKTLGGLAYKSAVAAATDSGPHSRMNRQGSKGGAAIGGGVGGLANRFFSRSAPAATFSTEDQDRRYFTSPAGSTGIDGYEVGKTISVGQANAPGSNRQPSAPPRTLPIIENGFHVTVLDLAHLTSDTTSKTRSSKNTSSPAVVMHFVASKSHPLSNMWFSASGTLLSTVSRDGQTAQIYEIRTDPMQRIHEASEDRDITSHSESRGGDVSRFSPPLPLNIPIVSPPPLYNLRRGRTPAVIDSADWASDGRWLAIGTRKRTVHVFAVNPYGGPSDIPSHTTGRVNNVTELPTSPTDVHPLVRLRVTRNPRPDQLQVPLAFTFLEPSVEEERRLPPNLLPPLSSPHLLPTHQHSYGSVSTVMSSSPSIRSDTLSLSPHQQLSPNGRPRNLQDILVFDPTDGILSLRRIYTDVKFKPNDGASILGTNFGSIGTGASRSLPGTNAGGRLSVSTSPRISSVATIGLPHARAENGELIGRENFVTSWRLRRGRDWPEKKDTLTTDGRGSARQDTNHQSNWLAQAELSTHSGSTRVLPRSIYLSHQFSFRTLGEDYHALIRRYQLDLTGTKIEVRKGIEVSAYSTGNSESFVEGGGFAIHYDRRRLSSSFDEPLTSALTGGLDHTPAQSVLPMFPNGAPGTKPRSFKNHIPIRTMTGIGDGMSEGIGRFKREIIKVRSPQYLPNLDSSVSASVPLEFDEEDEDFLSHEEESNHSQSGSHPVSPGEHSQETDNIQEGDIFDEDHDQWPGWVGEDRKAVEEAEMFDDISAVGLMDEEIHARLSNKGKNKKRNQF